MRILEAVFVSVFAVGSVHADFGDVRAWVNYRHTGPKPEGWVKPVRERFWGQDNFLIFERRGGKNLIQLNAREIPASDVADLLNADGTLRREAPPGYAYTGYCEWDYSASLPDDAHFRRMKFNNPGLKVRMGTGLLSYPLVMDFDGDGAKDVLLSCNCRRWYRTDFFRNLGRRGEIFPTFAAGVRVGASGGNTVVTHGIDGTEIVTTMRGEMYAGFPTNVYRAGSIVNLPDCAEGRANEKTWRLCDWNGDGKQDVLISADIWTRTWDDAYDADGVWTGGVNRCQTWIYTNRADSATAYARPFAVPGPNGASLQTGTMAMLEDFDGDGDLDILAKGPRNGLNYCQNVGTRTSPRYAEPKVVLDENGREVRMDSPLITPSALDWNGDGRPDVISGDESGGCAFIENTGKLRDGAPVFRQPRYFMQQADDLKVEVLPSIAAVDFDGDGDQDFLVGTSAGFVEWLENLSGPGVEEPKWAAPRRLSAKPARGHPVPSHVSLDPICIRAGENGSIQSPQEQTWGYLCISAGDWDGDGLVDLMFGDIRGEIHWFRNVGTRMRPQLAGPIDVEAEWPGGVQPELAWGWMKPSKMENPKAILTQWRCTPAMVDWNRDGLMDLVLVDVEGYLCLWRRARRADGALVLMPPERVLLNANTGKPLRPNPEAKGKSGRRRIAIADWDGDGKLDIFVSAQNAFWWRQVADDGGTWSFQNMGEVATDILQWHEASPAIVDFNADGIPDIVVTGEDGFFNYFRNPRTMLAEAKGAWRAAPKPPSRNLLKNPDFEGGEEKCVPKHWSLEVAGEKNGFSCSRGPGRNGTSGAVWESADKDCRCWLRQSVPVEGGRRYVAEVQIRTENLLGPEGAMLRLAWFDAGGRELGRASVKDSGVKMSTGGFVRKEVRTPFLPSEAVRATLSLFVPVGASGLAVFDDALVAEDRINPVSTIVSDVYRDETASGDVKFTAGLDLPGAHLRLQDVTGLFAVKSPDGRVSTHAAESMDDDRACLTLPVASLGVGVNGVAFALRRKADGKVLASAKMKFVRSAAERRRRVGFDRTGRCILDGKPFFPFGMYASRRDLNNDRLGVYGQAPFNLIAPYCEPTEAEMDLVHRHGLKILYETRNWYVGEKEAPPSLKREEDELFLIVDRVRKFAHHPALLAWYCNDEIDVSKIEGLVTHQKLFERLDPDHPSVALIYQIDNTRGYLGSCDVLGSDPYPIDEAPISICTGWTRRTRRGLLDSKPVWQAPQTFDWTYYRKKRGGGDLSNLRFPTEEEIVNMTWQTIAAGANGIVYYSFHDVFRSDPVEKAGERWAIVVAAAKRIKKHEATLVAADGPVPAIKGETDTIGARAFNVHGEIRLLVVNGDRRPQTAELEVGRRKLSVPLRPLESKWIDVNCGGKFGKISDTRKKGKK